MTNDELIDITCKWLDYFHSNYASQHADGTLYVAGTCQTDLRAYLNSIKNHTDYYDVLDNLRIKYKNVNKEL